MALGLPFRRTISIMSCRQSSFPSLITVNSQPTIHVCKRDTNTCSLINISNVCIQYDTTKLVK